jgi:serine/threonine protein kinase
MRELFSHASSLQNQTSLKNLKKVQTHSRGKNISFNLSKRRYSLYTLHSQVNLWKLFDHPNIVKFIDFSETQNNIYFFLEYCNQGDLEKLVKLRGRLSE